MKFGSLNGLASRDLFPEFGELFGELWSSVPQYHAVTCVSHLLMHLLWPPYGTGQAIIFSSCDFLLLLLLLSQPSQIGRIPYFHT